MEITAFESVLISKMKNTNNNKFKIEGMATYSPSKNSTLNKSTKLPITPKKVYF